MQHEQVKTTTVGLSKTASVDASKAASVDASKTTTSAQTAVERSR